MWQTQQPLTEIPGWLMFVICKGVPAPFLKHPPFDPASGSSLALLLLTTPSCPNLTQ